MSRPPSRALAFATFSGENSACVGLRLLAGRVSSWCATPRAFMKFTIAPRCSALICGIWARGTPTVPVSGPKDAQPIVFHHGWPLSADDWDNQMLFFLQKGFRVIAHDRRGHGRSTQTDSGNEMDSYAADVAQLVANLDLKGAAHIGHSTGGGEVARYVARAEPGRVARSGDTVTMD